VVISSGHFDGGLDPGVGVAARESFQLTFVQVSGVWGIGVALGELLRGMS